MKRRDMIDNLKGALQDAKKMRDANLIGRIRDLLQQLYSDKYGSRVKELTAIYIEIRKALKAQGGKMQSNTARQQQARNNWWDKMTPEERARYEEKYNIGGYDADESNRATRARERGLITASELAARLRKSLRCRTIAAADIAVALRYEELHHTGKNKKMTAFYDPRLTEEDIERIIKASKIRRNK